MLFSTPRKRYSFEKKETIKDIDFLSYNSIIFPSEQIYANSNLTCTQFPPNLYETSQNINLKMNMSHENIYDNTGMSSEGYENHPQFYNNDNYPQYQDDQYRMLESSNPNAMNQPLICLNGNEYAPEMQTGIDPGVLAVSNALFAYNNAFQYIPIKASPNVFRRRVKGEANSEWSNAFITRVDPCECTDFEEQFKPYEVTKYYDEGQVKTVFNFDQECPKDNM
ncbi:photosensitized INA-labeled protein PHIL1, putative [Plasmodium berghei]|uniref:Photosensitized INA-labeled protein PHIL1 n=2 Tax=Plasmodium berghei TaxID=5821 RepID=A0A509AE78_PLABA|nr:photosensitized INA-labeled protein PHIL1 [Plasmodium berghei ANKA]CXH86560.1 photosensitized INA-labeled protein PHIL1, putative [Plasmodium berghei]SCL90002.1 photosensitized INA-labeled protein PHIL1, putative [Plasmodium berghei]SCM15196.1 photosensitized INA-labeled protein PHIL1, putative [Plasmodium berghei]SCM16991.1 photosensitized INA-labeled protein PHIL1, putative [Plasmodium berghei]SCN21826.1 photosensitized INA-labeled protein PHIL1, putative [Plasmodium berghei]|eukprot:XP_034419772.1 photosensitized INA-labeled protein PHIL1 [Plasmodium berghei ANKA]